MATRLGRNVRNATGAGDAGRRPPFRPDRDNRKLTGYKAAGIRTKKNPPREGRWKSRPTSGVLSGRDFLFTDNPSTSWLANFLGRSATLEPDLLGRQRRLDLNRRLRVPGQLDDTGFSIEVSPQFTVNFDTREFLRFGDAKDQPGVGKFIS